MSFLKKVAKIQQELKAPKSQFNKFGGYNYRNCEDILEAVKPLLGDLVLTINDEAVIVGEGENSRVYIKATAKITDGEHSIDSSALAREPIEQKGMSDSQITGSASSYARKYALNGLFLIDDTRDADATNDHGKKEAKEVKKPAVKSEAKEETKTSFRRPKKKVSDAGI